MHEELPNHLIHHFLIPPQFSLKLYSPYVQSMNAL